VRPEVVPLVVVALLLLSSQPGVDSFTAVVGGSQSIEGGNDAVLVVDGNATVPAGERVDASVYVIDGTVDVEGTVAGDVLQFSGTVRAAEGALVTGRFQVIGGTQSVAPGADVSLDEVAEPLTQPRSPAEALGLFLMQALGLAVVGFLVGRRFDGALRNVAHSVRRHPGLSATVGLLVSVSLLALFVFMAFTIVLIPVTLLGILGGVGVFVYAYVAIGHLIGRRLDRGPGVATAAGTVAFLVGTELVSFVPVVGGVVPVLVLLVGVGAVFVTYFGLREFQPPRLQPVGSE
jgi:hypothetical protein